MKVFRRLPPLPERTPCALTIGNFDGVHRGHQALVSRLVADARASGLTACVLTFEPHPREFFAGANPAAAPAPARIATLRDKLEALRTLGIDRVCVAHFNAALAAMPADDFARKVLFDGLQARRILIGDDFRFGTRRTGNFDSLAALARPRGIVVEAMSTVVEDGERISSSAVRRALDAGDFVRVRELLGRAYRLSGRVVHGRKLGRTLGFPTLNLRFPHGRPAVAGIFVVRVHGLAGPDGAATVVDGVASLGTRPAVEADGRFLLEVHLLDWTGDAYGKLLEVEFLRKLRSERHFDSLELLTEQIRHDVDAARAHFDNLRLPS